MAGIYLHIPFCKQACHYCDFHFSTSIKKKDELVVCLQKELELRAIELKDETVETIYFGGGTPSLLSQKEIDDLLTTIFRYYRVSDTPEITLEANPDDLSKDTITKLATSKINRLSIGIQSFIESDLTMMNRAHNAQEAKESLSFASKHFDNISIDLIYGIPNMSKDQWRENLQIAFDFGIRHISSYALTVEPKTALHRFIERKQFPDVKEATARGHFEILTAETAKQGFIHYEISNFGKPSYFSRHNTSYWFHKKYVGVGPSAHSFNHAHRSWNVANNAKYIKAIQQNKLPNEIEVLSKNDRFNEYLMTGLRTIWGVSLDKIATDFGMQYKNKLLSSAEKFIAQELLFLDTKNTAELFQYKPNQTYPVQQEKTTVLKTTHKGKFLADGLASDLFII